MNTMTPEEKKELAEFAAEFLGLRYRNVLARYGDQACTEEFMFFKNSEYAAILMHLGKREMEKRGCKWKNYSLLVGRYIWKFAKHGEDIHGGIVHEDKNEFIAFWSAVREAAQ